MKTMSASEARRNFDKLIDDVANGSPPVVIESHGGGKVAVVQIRVAEKFERKRKEMFDVMRTISERVNLSEEDAMEAALAEAAAHQAELKQIREN